MAKIKYIETPAKLWDYFKQYRDHTRQNPIIVIEYMGKDIQRVEKPLQRPLTMEGFSSWLFENDIIKDVWQYFSNQGGLYTEYMDICSRIREIIRTDQIEGGMAGIYNPSITQRLNGLTDKTDITTGGSSLKDTPIKITIHEPKKV